MDMGFAIELSRLVLGRGIALKRGQCINIVSSPKGCQYASVMAREAYRTLKPTYTPLREQNMREATGSPIPELMRHSLLVAFYLKGKKTFQALRARP